MKTSRTGEWIRLPKLFPQPQNCFFFPGAASGRDDTTRRFLFTDMASGGRHRVFGVISPSGSPDRDDQTKLNKSDLQSRPPFSSFILVFIFFFFFIRLNLPHRFRRHRATKFTEEQRLKQKELLEVSAPPVLFPKPDSLSAFFTRAPYPFGAAMTITGSSSSLYDLRDYVHRCVLTEPRPRDETFNSIHAILFSCSVPT